MRIITFLTDFGLKSSYVAQMKGVVLSICDAKLIDITHNVSPHNIQEGAFNLLTAVNYFPVGTVHVAVVDPGVGTNRRGIIVTTKSQILVGPDNGVLIPAAKLLGDFTVYEIKNSAYMMESRSDTFHGRDVFAPVAAHIINNVPFERIGPKTESYVNLDFRKPVVDKEGVIGEILYVDHFGNVVTNIPKNNIKKFFDFNKKIKMLIGGKKHSMFFVRSYGMVEKNSFLTTINSSGLLEISINQGNAAEKLKVQPGEKIKIFYL